MANVKWSSFPNGGPLQTSDILVGIRAGVNEQFTAPVFGSEIVVVTTPTQAMASNTIYLANDPTSLVTFTLPATSAVGDIASVVGVSANGWSIAQGAGQSINLGALSSTVGVGGSLSSTKRYDYINIMCTVASTTWNAIGVVGNITIV